jgi:hypothetical protein
MSVTKLDLVAELFNHLRAEKAKHQREPSVVWVTDLVSCSLRVHYSSVYPELEKAVEAAVKGGLGYGYFAGSQLSELNQLAWKHVERWNSLRRWYYRLRRDLPARISHACEKLKKLVEVA